MGKKKVRFAAFLIVLGLVVVGMPEVGTVSLAATDDSAATSTAELSGAKTCTIKKKNGKWYYVNAQGKTIKKSGWKKNSSGKLTYYVNSKGTVTYKITKKGVLKKWKNDKKTWVKAAVKKNNIKKIGNKIFYIDSNGKVVTTSGWNGNYYIGANGSVTYKKAANKLYKVKGTGFVALTKGTYTIGDMTFKVSSSGTATIVEAEADETAQDTESAGDSTNSNDASSEQDADSTTVDTGCSHGNLVVTTTETIITEATGEWVPFLADYELVEGHIEYGFICNGCGASFFACDYESSDAALEALRAHMHASVSAYQAGEIPIAEVCGSYHLGYYQYDDIVWCRAYLYDKWVSTSGEKLVTTTYSCPDCGLYYESSYTISYDIAKTYNENVYSLRQYDIDPWEGGDDEDAIFAAALKMEEESE